MFRLEPVSLPIPDPAAEYQETLNKATGMLRAIEWARQLGA
jgi:anthranilate synthase component 1